jgi:hypothetical protein
MINALSPKGSLRSSRSVRSSLSMRSRPRSPEAVDASESPSKQQSARKQSDVGNREALDAAAGTALSIQYSVQEMPSPSALADPPATDSSGTTVLWISRNVADEIEKADKRKATAALEQGAHLTDIRSESSAVAPAPLAHPIIVEDSMEAPATAQQTIGDGFGDHAAARTLEEGNITAREEASDEVMASGQSLIVYPWLLLLIVPPRQRQLHLGRYRRSET